MNRFCCLLVEAADDKTQMQWQTLPHDRLPEGEVTVRVGYSSLNYKDALATQGHRGIIKQLPHVPGIDAAGTIEHCSDSSGLKIGDEVLVTGYDLGQGHWGGWSELIRVPANWIIPLPSGLSAREAMILGTAGFTAAQSVLALQRIELLPSDGEIVVTGATGGVASLAIRILAKLGYQVVAATGKTEQHDALLSAGATRVIHRNELADDTSKPLLSAKYAGAVDTVGGPVLTTLLRSVQYGGCITACGLVAGTDLPMTVYPFLLRGVSLCGIASADCPTAKRHEIWRLLANEWKPLDLESMLTEVTLEQMPAQVNNILAGKIVGRVLLRLH